MNHPFGPRGPYFERPCHRDRFPSLLHEMDKCGDKLVAHLGIPNINDMGARLKLRAEPDSKAEQRAADRAKAASVGPSSSFLLTKSLHLRRAVDIYMPRLEPFDVAELKPHSKDTYEVKPAKDGKRRYRVVPASTQVDRQPGERPYEGNCIHCQRTGSEDMHSDEQGRTLMRDSQVLEHLAYIDQMVQLQQNLRRNE